MLYNYREGRFVYFLYKVVRAQEVVFENLLFYGIMDNGLKTRAITGKMRSAVLNFHFSLFVKRMVVLVILFTAYVLGNTSDDLTLHAIILPGAPKILKDKKIMYGLDLVFGKKPIDYWIYYSKVKNKLIIDFYGVHVKGNPKVDFSGRGVFKDYKIINSKTNLSLSKKHGRVLIGMEPDPEWHFKSTVIDDRIVRIIVWKDITPLSRIEKKKKIKAWPFVLLGVIVASAAVSTAVIVYKYD